uniref:Putative phosphoprotein ECPP44-like n=1 Tax=Davidia involucrata TaxID=16924 RepID=A0A5B7A250_DAVIN
MILQSSEEEVEEGGEKKKKKKKGLKDKISGEKEEENTYIPIEKCDDEVVHAEAEKCDDEVVHAEAMTQAPVEEKKGFLEKIKEKLPGQHKKTEEVYPTPTPPPVECAATEVPVHEGSPKEKKGILEKIKEKLPGYHTKTPEEEKEIPH